MRAEAEAAAAQGAFGLTFIEDSYSKEWAVCEVEYETNKVVPLPPCTPPSAVTSPIPHPQRRRGQDFSCNQAHAPAGDLVCFQL